MIAQRSAVTELHEIARFRSKRLSEYTKELFFQSVEGLKENGGIKYDHQKH
ncbi:MAG: hypothetical protein PUB00_09415 [Clostridiales bacterium]|nr:hypothetical protein [Clostridiales bacterium]